MAAFQFSIYLALAFSLAADVACAGRSKQGTPSESFSNRGEQASKSGNINNAVDESVLFMMSIELKEKTWNSKKPLVVDVLFKNVGSRSVYINLKSAFQFNGFLTDRQGHTFRITWTPEGEQRTVKRSDYVEISPGAVHKITLASRKIYSEIGDKTIPWKSRKAGRYNFFVTLGSGSKTYFFPDQWEGQRVSNEIEINVQ